ncbi:cation:proton antiporter family protein [Solemya velum gill symbiont]|uniref:cation:proton antiporter family protein n=1 Tax=Solemya velum gill symbiont TaxID=2340 RepID=UPI000997CA20|nr:cation:proton antiporter family protein [Solemya velum gill symbiont]OOZ44422.1 potassium transporter Kef [Solemya velum gill symbiont]OOZ46221.1 potassium transporter Kef [Solemya velum gill symbiont]OOZ48799.1 potassium transporter Kef [Solemya velum gill symbiont]OOZ51303.1 potassium transporter Kef [Solemya velum gill symbiont]OOZ53856.1 potassium transporter Kef [Solemya velum gill symbiont]
MDPQLLSIHYSDPLWIAIAFLCGLAIKAIGLPPLVGFLFAGFMLNLLGAEGGEFLGAMADLGITLLLFSIGLKLKLRSLARPEVWGVATLHMAMVTFLISGMVILLSFTSLPLLSGLDIETALLVGFAMSFSSTVFAVKILDELGATSSMHGQIAIGVLVVQDIAAVVFIAVSIGKLPSLWALALVALIPLRFFMYRILDKVGHGELLILFGITLALVGADVFELVGIKEDVGALVFGMLLANHPKSSELAKTLLGFKELFLVGFFLSVGMTALPGWTEILVALVFIVFLPLKVAFYFGLFNLFRLRASTSWRSSLNLANYSEFGLIVGAVAVSAGWLSNEWLAVFAIVMSFSFIASAPLVNIRDSIYQTWRPRLKRYERPERLSGEEDLDLAHIKAVVFGMGRMGTAAYNAISDDYKDSLLGVEIDQDKAEKHSKSGLNVVSGDATNPDFWIRAPKLLSGLEWVLLTLPTHQANMNAALRLKEMGYSGLIAATTKYRDEEDALKGIGVDNTFNIYTEAGLGFANELQIFAGNKTKAVDA